MSYISPEHILLALLSQPDASGKRVLDRCAAAAWWGWCCTVARAMSHLGFRLAVCLQQSVCIPIATNQALQLRAHTS